MMLGIVQVVAALARHGEEFGRLEGLEILGQIGVALAVIFVPLLAAAVIWANAMEAVAGDGPGILPEVAGEDRAEDPGYVVLPPRGPAGPWP